MAINGSNRSMYPLEGYVCWVEEIPMKTQVLVTAFVVLGSLWILIWNSLLIVSSVTDSKLKEKTSSILIVNMALVDTWIGIVVFPSHAYMDLIRYQYNAPCLMAFFYQYLEGLFVVMSLLTAMTLNIDRWFYIKYPLRYPNFITRKRAYGLAAGCWITTAFILVGHGIYKPLNDDCISNIDSDVSKDVFSVIIRSSVLILPFLTVSIISVVLFGQTVRAIRQDSRLRSQGNTDRKLVNVTKRILKAGVTISVMNASFISMWMPYLVALVTSSPCEYVYIFLYIGFINSGVNPVVWCLLREYRRALKGLRKLCCVSNDVEDISLSHFSGVTRHSLTRQTSLHGPKVLSTANDKRLVFLPTDKP